MSTFTTLRAANIARQAEWDPGAQITLVYGLNELAGEVGEACNIGKKLERERLGIPGSRANPRDLADELADVVICADLVAMREGIDLNQAVIRKFNATSSKVELKTRLDNAAHPTRSDRQVAHRFRFAADILQGMTDGIDGDRLQALVDWALNGSATRLDNEDLIRAFALPHEAAVDEAGWTGDCRAEAIQDIARITTAAESVPKFLEPEWGWWASRDEEIYNVGPCATREQVIAQARDYFDGEGFHIAEAIQASVQALMPQGSAIILDALEAAADEGFFGEDGDYDLSGKPEEHIVAFGALDAALATWVEDWGRLLPTNCKFDSTRNREFIAAEAA